MKPIFEPGDFGEIVWAAGLAKMANDKLTSLGIDAGTPEKLKALEWASKNNSAHARAWDYVEILENRLSELERMIAEGPIVYANCMRTFGDSDPYVFELDSDWSTEKSSQDTHCAHLVRIGEVS